jgi:2-isopropylmalate synthase
VVATAEGNGPVNAPRRGAAPGDRAALPGRSASLHLTDYRVRVLDTGLGTGAVTRVLVDTSDGERTWTTIGVSENIIEASWQALYDSIVYGLLGRCMRVTARVSSAWRDATTPTSMTCGPR